MVEVSGQLHGHKFVSVSELFALSLCQNTQKFYTETAIMDLFFGIKELLPNVWCTCNIR